MEIRFSFTARVLRLRFRDILRRFVSISPYIFTFSSTISHIPYRVDTLCVG